MLSDLCHPATGTAILLTKQGRQPRSVMLLPSVDDHGFRWLFWNVELLVAPIALEALQSLLALGLEAPPSTSRPSFEAVLYSLYGQGAARE
jgi:hypothetical protein